MEVLSADLAVDQILISSQFFREPDTLSDAHTIPVWDICCFTKSPDVNDMQYNIHLLWKTLSPIQQVALTQWKYLDVINEAAVTVRNEMEMYKKLDIKWSYVKQHVIKTKDINENLI
jgi:hypothetical protein